MITKQSISLVEFMRQGPYVGYAYSYPHKTAYRPFNEPKTLTSVWNDERQESLFLYVHIPFCEFRCGFCNLFTFSQPDGDLPTRYLHSIRRHANAIRQQLPGAHFSRLAIGGGTPSFLNVPQLEHLLVTLADCLGVLGNQTPASFEVSPSTLDKGKLKLLHSFGIRRLSMGVQSLDAQDVASLGRPQSRANVYRSIEMIRDKNFETLNLDLIYGAEHQTLTSWSDTVDEIIRIRPEEVYLYPLYVRPLTGLANVGISASDLRPAMYRLGRDKLLAAGYRALSMRMFQLPGTSTSSLPDYRCQRDGMIGLGCGARSYTSTCHYGSSYAVKQSSILRRIQDYIGQADSELGQPMHGVELDEEERRRRHLILSLLLMEGLDCREYFQLFGAAPLDHFPELAELCEQGMAVLSDTRLQLTELGIEWSDTIGPWLYSEIVRNRMTEFAWTD